MTLDTPLMCVPWIRAVTDKCPLGVSKPTAPVCNFTCASVSHYATSTAMEEMCMMNVQATRSRLEPCDLFPAIMSIHVGHTLVLTHLALAEIAISSRSNIGYVTLVVNTQVQRARALPCHSGPHLGSLCLCFGLSLFYGAHCL